MLRIIWAMVALSVLVATPAIADDRLEFMKALAGEWVAEGEELNGKYEFRVTAGGHAVEEREMIDTPMEMLTVYHLDGGDLVGTHYCMMGNRPRVIGSALSENSKRIEFTCDGKPGNTRSHDDPHIHHWSMTLQEDGSLQYDAVMKTGDDTQNYNTRLRRAN